MASSCRKSLTVTLLEHYYAEVHGMRPYLSDLLETDGGHAFLPSDSDSEEYHSLINSSFVALKSLPNYKRRIKVFPPMMYMHEIIDRAQEKLFKSKGKSSNVILSGYRLASKNGEGGKRAMSRIGITNYFVNTIITALQAPEWETLLQRVGADAMIHLLTEANIFVSLPNGCLCQITGEPIVHMDATLVGYSRRSKLSDDSNGSAHVNNKRTSICPHADERAPKRTRLQTLPLNRTDSWVINGVTMTKESKDVVQFSPADIPVVRARMFYARPTYVPATHNIIVGLPFNHILNRINPSYQRPPKIDSLNYVDPDPRKQLENARHLAKYVFPRQYGLTSPFGFATFKKNVHKLPDFTDRESEIKVKGSCKTPKRLKETLKSLEKLIWRHGKCGYKPLQNHACPSKVKTSHAKPIDSSIILEMMSENSIQLHSQAPNVSADTSIAPQGLSQAERHAKHKPRFAEFSCSHHEVYCYAVLVSKAVIPKRFWGCERNFKLVLRSVKEVIAARRYETITLHGILQGFSTSECDWLMPSTPQMRVSVSDALKRRELLEEFLFWYFDGFLMPLLKTSFYITDSSAFRNQVLYFRQDDWEVLCKPLIERLTCDTFEKMSQFEAEEILRQRKLGFSFVRLLPKETGVRPIVNLKRKKPAGKAFYAPAEQSINQILQAAFNILTYEKQTQPQRLGVSVFGPNEVYDKLKDFKLRLPRSQGGEIPQLYFVKLDVQACFDTIEQTKLLEILKELISEDIYMIQRYGRVTHGAHKIKRCYKKAATPADDHPHFLKYASELASVLRHTIFVDQVVYPYSKKHDILHLLEEHITENIVKIGPNFYRQMVGIPQGSVLSTLLCSFFYGDLERRFGSFTDSQSTMMRLVDDYLYITTDLSKAKKFLEMMDKGHPEYGCFVSKDKTLTNFDHDSNILGTTGPLQKRFPWCGFLIDMKDLSVSVDYTRYHSIRIDDTLTVDKGRHAGSAFRQKMLRLAVAKSHNIYCDTEFNTDHTVFLNIYQNFLLSAMKMHRYIRSWGIDISKSHSFIHDIVRQMISYAFTAIQNRTTEKRVHNHNRNGRVPKNAVVWLGTHAFHTVLTRKPQKYGLLIKALAFQLSLPRHRRPRKRFGKVVKEGLVGMTGIVF